LRAGKKNGSPLVLVIKLPLSQYERRSRSESIKVSELGWHSRCMNR
jgi:hypothetical protein